MTTAQEVYAGDILSFHLPPGLSGRVPAIIFADPPYNFGKNYGPTSDDCLSSPYYLKWADTWMTRLMEIDFGSLWCLFPSQFHNSYRPTNKIIWHETFANYHEQWFPTAHRELHVWRRDNLVWNPDAIRVPSARQTKYNDKRANPKGRVPDSVWTFPRVCGTHRERVDWHPTQLPYRLLERIVLACSNPGDLVFEAFAGSGILGCVCKDLSRDYLGIEINPDYVSLANTRIGEWNGYPRTRNPSSPKSR